MAEVAERVEMEEELKLMKKTTKMVEAKIAGMKETTKMVNTEEMVDTEEMEEIAEMKEMEEIDRETSQNRKKLLMIIKKILMWMIFQTQVRMITK
eukprot:CAMPEP_0116889766 /NCGR_PEP_ID=MMETSP0467-20121206/302_1 /TAXON_ID=283647 /ORGANISM="Mesodinium pulex, Strain SPMC105" /LENGTH=94 /DNA_ID=CAMNT_0004556849 /DNA_START=1182 /DNA_END=1466 /DNA_ORIENTATION=+